MPTNTSKFNLVKPLKSEKYNVDVFNGNADVIDSQIYSKTEVDTALNGKANTTTTINNKALSTNITINASDVPNTPAGNISATNIQNALNELDTEKVDKLFATNLVQNGDFSNGTTGWTSSSGVLSMEGEYITFTSATTDVTPSFRQLYNTISGRRYYFRSSSIIDINATQRFLLFGTSTNEILGVSVLANVENVFSGVITALTNNTTFGFGFSSSEQVAKRVRMRRPLIIDLTATFGAGNEPTKWQMDHLLSNFPNSWFNGTSEIGSIGALMRATLGVQLVTPTLLNSRTGTAQYVVSNDGLVIFRGTASGGSLNTNIFVLPENIRPVATRVFPIFANSAFGVVTVAANGEVRQMVGALTNVFLDGIVFKVGV